MKKLVIAIMFFTSISVFANTSECVNCNSYSPELFSIYNSFDQFCSNISSLSLKDQESAIIKRIAGSDEFKYLDQSLKHVPKDTAHSLLSRLQTVQDEFDESINKRKHVLNSLESKLKIIKNEISNLEAAKSSIDLLDQYLNNKLCDDRFSEGTRRGVEVCQNGQWVNTMKY